MITQEAVDFIGMKEPRYEFLIKDGIEEITPQDRPLVRIHEAAGIITARDLYNSRAQLELSLKKADADLTPAVIKTKVQNLKNGLKQARDDIYKTWKQYDDEIKIIEAELKMNELESDFHLTLHKKLAEESKQTEWAEQKD